MRLKNKVVVITGGGSGVGRTASLLFAQQGASVVVADYVADAGEETASMVRKCGGAATFISCDISNVEQVQNLIAGTISAYGKITCLYNNAGIWDPGDARTIDLREEIWDKVIAINLTGVFLTCKYGIPEIIKAGGGSVINTAPVIGVIGSRVAAAYSASKGAVIALTKSLALEYAPEGVRANSISPGTIETPMMARYLDDPVDRKKRVSLHPLGRLGTPEDVAYLALYLASDESTFVTGANLLVDGGRSVD